MKYPCLLTKKINEISSAKYNPRKITDEAMGRLTKSLAELGNIQPITWNVRTGNVVGGHQRLKVYKAMGKTEVDVWAVDLDEQKEKAANIALNKLSGEFDMPMLKDILEEIDTGDLDMEITGFGMDEIALMMEDAHPEVTEDEVPEVPVDAITKPGDLWILGEHRVLCGDSTKAEDMDRLMNGEIVCGIVTDPPYGIGIDGQKESICKNPKHNRKAHAFLGWDSSRPDKSLFDSLLSMNCPSAIFGGNYFADLLPATRGWIYWSKGQDGLTMSDGELAWTNLSKPLRCVKVNRAALHGSQHPTQKPVEVMIFTIKYIEPKDGIIYDPFLGSGTTLIASEQLGRKCYGMEISPNYCDVIVKRWENLTSKKATLAK
jgi:DNA modification methylase